MTLSGTRILLVRTAVILTLVYNAIASAEDATTLIKLHLCTEINSHSASVASVTSKNEALIRQAAKSLNLQVHIERLSWQRCIRKVKDGRRDGLFALIHTPERDKFLAFPQSSAAGANKTRLKTSSFYFFENPEHPLDLDNLRFGVGAQLGYVVRKKLEEQKLLSPIDYDLQEGLNMVALGKLDAYVAPAPLANVMIDKLKLGDKVQIREPAFFTRDLHVAFNKGFYHRHTETIQGFWRALERNRVLQP